uniref:trypsin n=1 Tax=Oncorhynchus tshawytscha TaxID=74940 RepID=A0A8C8BW53_ONCTS
IESIPSSESGIVGGKIAKPHSRPYMVSLQHRGHHVCGGMLIREDFVLTSAHCLRSAYPLTVVLGAHDLTKEEKKSRQEIQVVHHHRHPLHRQYSQLTYDIMLLQLETKAKLNRYVNVTGLPKEDGSTPANIKCSVAGWGKTNSNNQGSGVLMEVAVTVGEDSEFILLSHFCLFSNSSCSVFQGDSGGPLICNNKAQGIVAFNYPERCDDSQYPHVFMKIPFFLPWIKEVLHGYGANMSLNKQE